MCAAIIAHPGLGGIGGSVVRIMARLLAAGVLLLPRRQLLPAALLAVLQQSPVRDVARFSISLAVSWWECSIRTSAVHWACSCRCEELRRCTPSRGGSAMAPAGPAAWAAAAPDMASATAALSARWIAVNMHLAQMLSRFGSRGVIGQCSSRSALFC